MKKYSLTIKLYDIPDKVKEEDLPEYFKKYINVFGIIEEQIEVVEEKEVEKLKMYIKYVEEYANDHEIRGNYPVCYNEWLNNEYEEIK